MASIPAEIPDTAFLQIVDVPGLIKGIARLADGERQLPRFCGAPYDQPELLGLRATRRILFSSAGSPPEATPKAAVYEDILIFRGTGAQAFVTGLRDAVQACASQADEVGFQVRNVLRGTVGAGDESVLVESSRPATNNEGDSLDDGSEQSTFLAVARVGDAVTLVTNEGWETGSADQGDTVLLAQRATHRLASWRP